MSTIKVVGYYFDEPYQVTGRNFYLKQIPSEFKLDYEDVMEKVGNVFCTENEKDGFDEYIENKLKEKYNLNYVCMHHPYYYMIDFD